MTRRGNLDVLVDAAGDRRAVCTLAPLLPLTSRGAGRNLYGAHNAIAAIALAAQHLNAGDGAVVPAVAGLSCPLVFGLREVFDTGFSESQAVDGVIQMTDPANVERRLPCAIFGAMRSAVSAPTAIISGIRGYPQFSHTSTANTLDNKEQCPLFGRTIAADDSSALAVIKLYVKWGVNHLGVVHVGDNFGKSYLAGMRLHAENIAPNMILKSFEMPFRPSPRDIKQVVRLLKQTGYRYFYGIGGSRDEVDALLAAAYDEGIAGNGRYNWVHDAGKMAQGQIVERGSPKHMYLNGLIDTGVNPGSALGGTPGFRALEAGLRSLLEDPRDLELVRSFFPPELRDTFGYEEGFLDSLDVSSRATFMYDAVIATGLAACNITAELSLTSDEFELTGKDHFAAFGFANFTGVTGHIEIDPKSGTRVPSSAMYHLLNYVEDTELSNDTHVVFKETIPAFMIDNEWKEHAPVIFNDNTPTVIPDLFPVDFNPNYLSPGMRAGGLLMCALVLLQAIVFAAWTVKSQHTPGSGRQVVQASQPLFLYIICAGAVIMGSAIIPLSFDGGNCSGEGCNAACGTFPWLLCLGFSAIFSALFTKTHRITRIMKAAKTFKRLTVTPADVAKRMLVLMGANIIVLGLWAGLDPLRYETETVQRDIFDREVETYSFCACDNPLPYVLPLAAINVGSLMYAVYMAWKAKDISTEFSESLYIFKILIGILLVCFVGIPVMVIARDSPQAYFYVFSALIFLVSTLVLGLIFVPKITASKKKFAPNLASMTSSLSRTSEDGSMIGGVKVYTKPMAQMELEQENAKLLQKQLSYESQIEHLQEQMRTREGDARESVLKTSEEEKIDDEAIASAENAGAV